MDVLSYDKTYCEDMSSTLKSVCKQIVIVIADLLYYGEPKPHAVMIFAFLLETACHLLQIQCLTRSAV